MSGLKTGLSGASAASTRRRRGLLPLLAGMGLLVAAGNASASWYCYAFWAYGAPCPVMENGSKLAQQGMSMANTLATKVKDVAEYAKQAQQWLQTAQHYLDMMTNIQATLSQFTLPQGQEMQKVADDYNVADKCGGDDVGSAVSSVLGSMVGFSGTDNVKQSQRRICASMQTMRNRQYNEMVDFMQSAGPKLGQMVQQLDGIRTASSTPGQMASAINATEQTNRDLQQKMAEFKSRMTAYETYLKSQEDVQRVLAQNALRGQNSIKGQVIKTVALKAAFSD